MILMNHESFMEQFGQFHICSCLLPIYFSMEVLVHETILEFHTGKQQRLNLMGLHCVTVIQAVQQDV